MAREAAKAGKSETLTIRLDPKSRFVLEYLSRLKGQTITTVVERAIVKAADQETLTSEDRPFTETWQNFWDVSDGVRALRLADRSEFFPTYEEEKRLAFCREHWPFFWTSRDRSTFLRHNVDVLWPRIDEFVGIHDARKAEDYFAAGKAMQDALRGARLKTPEWPIPQKPAEKVQPKLIGEPSVNRDMDDDIPF